MRGLKVNNKVDITLASYSTLKSYGLQNLYVPIGGYAK